MRIVALISALVVMVLFSAWSNLGFRPQGSRLERLHASQNYRDGRFVNGLPAIEPAFIPTLWRWIKGVQHARPQDPPPIASDIVERLRHAPNSGLRVTWLGHSSMVVEIDGARFLTDPVWSDRCAPWSFMGPSRFFAPPLPLVDLPPLDAVVISHDHYDHLDAQTIRNLAAKVPLFVVPLGVGAHLEGWGVAPERIVELDWWQEHQVAGVRLVATPARHFSGRAVVDRDHTLWASWGFVGPQHRVFFSGDTAMFPGFAEIGERLGPFDLTMIEVGAYDQAWADVHLGPEQAVAAHRALRGRTMMPVHWGTFDLALHGWTEPAERVIVAAQAAQVPLAVLRPGASTEPTQGASIDRWWPQVPWRRAEEAPVVSSGLADNAVAATAQPTY